MNGVSRLHGVDTLTDKPDELLESDSHLEPGQNPALRQESEINKK